MATPCRLACSPARRQFCEPRWCGFAHRRGGACRREAALRRSWAFPFSASSAKPACNVSCGPTGAAHRANSHRERGTRRLSVLKTWVVFATNQNSLDVALQRAARLGRILDPTRKTKLRPRGVVEMRFFLEFIWRAARRIVTLRACLSMAGIAAESAPGSVNIRVPTHFSRICRNSSN